MKYLNEDMGMRDADSGDEAGVSIPQLENELAEVRQELMALPAGFTPVERAAVLVRIAELLVDLSRGEEAFDNAREAFDVFAEAQKWESAAAACNAMFLADQSYSLAALGQGVWLAVTFPIDIELSVALLQHIIDETPTDSDGAAVAAVVARYLVDLRAEGKMRDNLMLFTNHMLGTVARRHSEVEKQEQFDFWLEKMELTKPEKFLPRLRNVVDVLVQDDWWVDRDAIWASLPDQ
ncbi:MAG: hypothetical protein COB30_019345 [Ectothiorhodospiraceae bacterium]|nr:hypothetical protein [Ectothiorhodospiraceae bacterium]